MASTQQSSNDNSNSNNNSNSSKAMRVVVVGGGPSGAAAAKAMADRGYTNVNLYEAYPRPSSLSKTSSMAYMIALSPRGIQGIRDATSIDILSEAEEAAEAAAAETETETTGNNTTGRNSTGSVSNTTGTVSYDMTRHVHNPKTNTTSTQIMNHQENPFCLIQRKALTERLLKGAHSSGVAVHYQHRLKSIDFAGRVATFATADGNESAIAVGYDLLLGADGCNSTVRNLLVENDISTSTDKDTNTNTTNTNTTNTDTTNGDQNRNQHDSSVAVANEFTARVAEDSMEYQVAFLPDNPYETTHPKGAAHTWNNKELNAICLGFPTDKQTSCSNSSTSNSNSNNNNNKMTKGSSKQSMVFAIVFPEGRLESFRTTGYREPLTKLLPDLLGSDEAALVSIEHQLRENQIANGGKCVWSSAFGHAGAGVILLGDAAHGMWPSLGQGANCALETVGIFVRCLDEQLLQEREQKNNNINTNTKNTTFIRDLLHRFQASRYEDAIAAVDLTYGGIGARKSRGRQNAPLGTKLQFIGMIALSKLTLGAVPMPALLQLMGGRKDYSYSKAKKFHFCYEKWICGAAALMTMTMAVVAAKTTTLLGGGGTEL